MTTPTDTDLAQALLPCPFCGSKNVVHVTADHPKHAHYVLCMMCDSPSAMRDTSAHAAESWNRRDHESRAQPASVVDGLADAAKALRAAQRAYMADRGNELLGKAVGVRAAELDYAILVYAAAPVGEGE